VGLGAWVVACFLGGRMVTAAASQASQCHGPGSYGAGESLSSSARL
jgi:hypothetical protein